MKLLEKLFDIIEFKGNSASGVLKIVVGFMGTAVAGAFMYGQVKMKQLNKLEDIESMANKSIEMITNLETSIDIRFDKQEIRIDQLYIDGMEAFKNYNEFHKEQLRLVLKYGKTNQEMLTEMLEFNAQQKAREMEGDLKRSKIIKPDVSGESDHSIIITPDDFPRVWVYTDDDTGISTYEITGAPKDYLDTLNFKHYVITYRGVNKQYPHLYDFEYMDKKK